MSSDRHRLPALTRPAITGTQGIFAQRRKGKSYLAQTQAEDWLEDAMQIAVIDPTSAWWGLRSSADGKAPGYPITIFGGEHGDAPLELKSGALIAEAMVTERFSAVLDLSLLDAEDWPVVAGDFLDTLYRLNRTAMHVFLDEADQFAPQTTADRAQQRCRRIVNRVVRLGGVKGIGSTVITQRTAVLDKNITEMCDTVVVLQMNGARDLKTLRDWLSNHAERDLVDTVISSLGKLQRGQAWVLSPGSESFELMAVRAKRTFDSGRTPEAGEVLTPPKALAAVDLKRLGAAIAATVEKAKANDPVALKARVALLEQQLVATGRAPATAVVKTTIVERPILKEAEIKRLEAASVKAEQMMGLFGEITQRVHEVFEHLAVEVVDLKAAIHLAGMLGDSSETRTSRAPAPSNREIAQKHFANDGKVQKRVGKYELRVPAPKATAPIPDSKAPKLDSGDVLNAIATISATGLDVTMTSLSAWMGLHPKTNSLLTKLGQLRRDGLLDLMALTDNGRAVAHGTKPTQEEQREHLRGLLTESQRKVVDMFATFQALDREPTHTMLAAWIGLHPKTNSLLKDVGWLRDRGFLNGSQLSPIGERAAQPAYKKYTVSDILAPLDQHAQKLARLALDVRVIPTMTALAEHLGVHPKTNSTLTALGELRGRGLITKDWPLKPTSVFPGAA